MKKNLMNTKIIYAILIVSLAVASCSKDSDSNTVTLEGGTWTAGTPTFTAMVGNKTLNQYFMDVMGLTTAQAAQYTAVANLALIQSFTGTIQFKSDNTYTANLGGTPDSGTWSLSADGKKLTIVSGAEPPETADVIELTSNKLTIAIISSESEDLNGDSVPETLTVNVTIPFTR